MMGLAAFDAPHLLILDEPTNHLDIDSREALVHALNDYSGAVILITHDRHLIEACADRLWLVAGQTVKPFDGDIEDYRRMVLGKADGTTAQTREPDRSPTQKDMRREAALRREALAPLRKKIKDCERALDTLRQEIADLDRQLAEPGLYADTDRAADAGEEPQRADPRLRKGRIRLAGPVEEQLEAEEAGEKVA